MWTKLLCHIDLKEGMKPRILNGKWRKPLISGRRKAELKKYFEIAGVPWIYSSIKNTFNLNSPYNKIPKTRKSEIKKEIRNSEIAKNITHSDEKDFKSRMERLDKKALKGKDKFLQFALPLMLEQAHRNIQTVKATQEFKSSKKRGNDEYNEDPFNIKVTEDPKSNENIKNENDLSKKSDTKEMQMTQNLKESQKTLKKKSKEKKMNTPLSKKLEKEEEDEEDEGNREGKKIEQNLNSEEIKNKQHFRKNDTGLNNLGNNLIHENILNPKLNHDNGSKISMEKDKSNNSIKNKEHFRNKEEIKITLETNKKIKPQIEEIKQQNNNIAKSKEKLQDDSDIKDIKMQESKGRKISNKKISLIEFNKNQSNAKESFKKNNSKEKIQNDYKD